MATNKHDAIKDFLMNASSGAGNANKRMVMNPRTGKFEVVARGERHPDDAPQITAEDMKSFQVTGDVG